MNSSKRGSFLGRKSSSTSEPNLQAAAPSPPHAVSFKEKEEEPGTEVVKNPTFGRASSRPVARASMKDVFGLDARPSSPSSLGGSPVALSPGGRGESPPPKLSKRNTAMIGMAAAFDALISSEEADTPPPPVMPVSPAKGGGRTGSVSKSAEELLVELQVKYEQLEKEHEDLKLKYRLLEASVGSAAANSGSSNPNTVSLPKETLAAPPPSLIMLSPKGSDSSSTHRKASAPTSKSASGVTPLSSMRSASASNIPRLTPLKESSAAAKDTASPDSVKEELSRVRREIKQQLMLPIKDNRVSDPSEKDLGPSKGTDWLEDSVAVEKFERNWLTSQTAYKFGDWRMSRAPGRTLVVETEGFNVESGDVAQEALSPRNQYPLVEPHLQTSFYTDFMSNIKHLNLVGLSGIGAFADIPMIISVEQVNLSRSTKLRRKPLLCMIRTPSGTEQLCFCGFDAPIARLPYEAGTFVDFLRQRFPNIRFASVKNVEHNANLMKSLVQYDSMNIVKTYKFGVLRWESGQDENAAFRNGPSPAFTSFLNWIGERVELMGWTKFRGGLNVRDLNVTGTHSYYTTLPLEGIEIMFHVSTELPFSETDAQCLERKRHLGNDVVLVVFWEGEGEFDPTLVKSQFNHVFVVIAVDPSSIAELGKIRYRISIVCKPGVPRWEPFMPFPPVFDRGDTLRTWLLYKLVNAERAAMHAPVFRTKLTKTNTVYLRKLVDTYFSEDAVEDFVTSAGGIRE